MILRRFSNEKKNFVVGNEKIDEVSMSMNVLKRLIKDILLKITICQNN
jgi:hypothetical protein